MKIIRFKATDVLRLSVVEVTPQGNLVTIGGENGAGKSSLLDAIQLTLMGKKAMPEEPVRRGAKRAETFIELGENGDVELIVERSITAGGSDTLVVRAPEGAPQKRPQELLNKLFGTIAFDPIAFAKMDAAPQAELLRKLVGLDFSELDAERSRVYEDRTIVGREEKAAKARYEGMPFHDDAPDDEVSLAQLAEEMTAHQAAVKAREQLEREVVGAKFTYDRALEALAAAKVALERAANFLAEAEAKLVACRVPESDIEAQIQSADAFNAKVRANRDKARAKGEHEVKLAAWGKLDERVKDIAAKKAAMLSAAAFPVPGLSMSDSGVTFEGFPFAQVNTASKLRVSLAIGMAMNPKLKVMFVRDGSLLDKNGLHLIAEMAAAGGFQVWMEDARTTDPTAVIIEDGRVQGMQESPENTGGAGATAGDEDEEPL